MTREEAVKVLEKAMPILKDTNTDIWYAMQDVLDYLKRPSMEWLKEALRKTRGEI